MSSHADEHAPPPPVGTREFDGRAKSAYSPVGRAVVGPNRYYVEIHPQALRGFVDIAAHPWLLAVAESVLGPDYKIIEVGFDLPGPGAMNQPWHRYFPMPEETRLHHRLMGDISARSALTLHRGTSHASTRRQPVLVVGVDASELAPPGWSSSVNRAQPGSAALEP